MKYSIVKADLEKDKDYIKGFWKKNFPNWSEGKYSWFYKDNPQGKAICWLAKVPDNNEVVGTIALFPRNIIIKGKSELAAITGDYAVSKDHRGYWPAISLQKAKITGFKESHISLLYGSANQYSAPLQKRAGFKAIGKSVRLVKLIKSENHIRRYTNNKLIVKAVSRLTDKLLKYISKESYYRKNKKFKVEILTSFDKRFDDLWLKAADQYAIVGERTSQFLNWRFTACPYKTFNIFALTQNSIKEILGYFVYQIDQGNAQIVDFFAIKEDEILNSIILEFLNYHRHTGTKTVVLNFFGDKSIINRFNKFGFSIREEKGTIFIYFENDSLNKDYLFQEDNWYFLHADNDAEA